MAGMWEREQEEEEFGKVSLEGLRKESKGTLDEELGKVSLEYLGKGNRRKKSWDAAFEGFLEREQAKEELEMLRIL